MGADALTKAQRAEQVKNANIRARVELGQFRRNIQAEIGRVKTENSQRITALKGIHSERLQTARLKPSTADELKAVRARNASELISLRTSNKQKEQAERQEGKNILANYNARQRATIANIRNTPVTD